ncbi:cytochrome P450 [Nonomuraea sp. NPDC050663]|uniref:cytochrome P450 n=1 Tax=Nonomuraea sp. NPDC050663 TaxID=3364370 RepID=UPI0037AC5BDC
MRELPTTRSCPFGPPDGAADEPMTKVRLDTGDEIWFVSRHDLVRQVYGDARFSSEIDGGSHGIPLHRTEPIPGMFIQMDPPRHTRLRRLVTGRFTVQRMKTLRPRIEQIVADQLDHLAAQPRPADLVTHFALPIPSLVICELLGVPYSDRERFQRAGAELMRMDSTAEQSDAALLELSAYLVELLRRPPGPGLLADMIGTGLTEEELAGMAILLLVAGHETTANVLALGTLALLEHPAQLELVRQGKAPDAVDELLRWLSVVDVGLYRLATEPVEIGGRRVEAGEFVTSSLGAANRDPSVFERPQELDVTRPRTHHLAFGFGAHQCLGQNLARMELDIAFPALLRRLPELRLAVPLSSVPFRDEMAIYGVHRLEVTW